MVQQGGIRTARLLRANATEAEAILWNRLRNRQLENAKFVRQHPIGPYVADFCCRSAKLVIEVDGGQHADNPHDVSRADAIATFGYLVLRFWNNEVPENIEGGLETVADLLRMARNAES